MKTCPNRFLSALVLAHSWRIWKLRFRAIAFDLTLDAPADSASDAEFDAVLSKYSNIILATKSPEESGAGNTSSAIGTVVPLTFSTGRQIIVS